MVYPKDFESKIGFNVLRDLLSKACLSELGQIHCDRMSMLTNRLHLIKELHSVDEMKKIIESTISLPIDHLPNPLPYLTVLKAEGSHINEENYADLASFLTTERKLRLFFSPDAEKASERIELTDRFRNIPKLDVPLEEINKIIDKFGEVRDNASPLLAEIRRKISATTVSLNGMVRRVLTNAVKQGLLPADASPTMRDGHLVIPVPATNKKLIPGIVFDQSATGKTCFIEPAQVVEANNVLKSLKLDENKEIIEILTNLSNKIRPYIPDMEDAAHQIGLIDFIRAKAVLAINLNAQLPAISKSPELDWYHAVHPVLFLTLKAQGRQVVPLDLKLDEKTRIVIISGPNAGGKSVCLKTIAIVQYMMQCGLLPTLYSNSHMGVFTKLMIDIGDEQSLENDLSTYSSHLRNMKNFLAKAGPDTIFLADEMGGGTEPQIGGAIAQAILSKLNEDKAFGVVTTHYQNLKTFANETPGIVNAAMLYDRQHLQPLFKFSMGTPGSSFALDIARKSGIPNDVIANARNIAGSEYVNIDNYIHNLARDKKYWADKRLAIREKERKLDQLYDELHDKAEELKAKRAEIMHQAKAEAKNIMESANAKIENAIRAIKSANADKEKSRQVRLHLEEYKKKIQEMAVDDNHPGVLDIPVRKKKNKGKSEKEANISIKNDDELNVGDFVLIPSSSTPGRILSITGKKAEVALGNLRSVMDLSVLKRTKKPQQMEKNSSVSISTSEDSRRRQLNFNNEIDVRGFRADEALQAITYFLDDAIQFQASRVRILHGTGTGALRMAIRQKLQADPAVTSFHDEDVRFGGAGITVVNLE